MDDQDTKVESNVGSRLVETLGKLKVVKETVFVEVSTFHQVGYLISEIHKGEGEGRERERERVKLVHSLQSWYL